MELLILIFAVGFLCYYLMRHPIQCVKGIFLVALWFVLGCIITGLVWLWLQ